MKMKRASVWIYTLIAVVGLSLAACGNSQKKRERVAERKMAEQPLDTLTVMESETVIVIDSLSPDTTVLRKKAATPEKTK